MATKDGKRGLCDDGNVLYFDCINVDIPVLILYYSFIRGHHWMKLVKGLWVAPYYFLTKACEFTVIFYTLFNLKLINEKISMKSKKGFVEWGHLKNVFICIFVRELTALVIKKRKYNALVI